MSKPPPSLGWMVSEVHLIATDALNGALHLEGRVLDGGWIVGPMNKPHPDATGGVFSVSYPVSKSSGQQGFLKVINLVRALQDIDLMQYMINEYIAERDLLEMCAQRRLSRVITAIEHGQFTVPEYPLGGIYYIIFELATSDVRVALSQGKLADVVMRLELFHNLAVGLRQLHGLGVAHQDLKPSNFLLIRSAATRGEGKIADLGRAFREGHPTLHDDLVRPGDLSYAPPEQLYGFTHPDIEHRRYAADLYQLGNLGAFIFGAVTINALLWEELAPEHRWGTFADGYEQAIPYVRDAYGRVLERIRVSMQREAPSEVIDVISYLCDPNAERRGHPRAQPGVGSKLALQRVVSQIDLLARRAAVQAAGVR